MFIQEENSSFFDLPSPRLPDNLDGFTLDSVIYEHEIASRNGGLCLDSDKSIAQLPQDDLDHYAGMIPFLHKTPTYYTIEEALQIHTGQSSPSSMLLKNRDKLANILVMAFQSAYAHYVHGKKINYKFRFPIDCCGISSRNMFVSFLHLGFPNAASFRNDNYDHDYFGLPFVLEDENIKGCIVVDPTSDQCWHTDKESKRNQTMIKLGTRWVYRTDWKGGADLFPTQVMHLGTL